MGALGNDLGAGKADPRTSSKQKKKKKKRVIYRLSLNIGGFLNHEVDVIEDGRFCTPYS